MSIGVYIAAGIAAVIGMCILYAFVDRICTCIERKRVIEHSAPDDDLHTLLEKIKKKLKEEMEDMK